MHFLYAIINVLLLGGIIFLVGRKTIANIFSSRRERIERELTEAETPFVPEPLPEEEALPVPHPEEALSALREERERELAAIEADSAEKSEKQRREMLLGVRSRLIGDVVAHARERMVSDEYRAALVENTEHAAESILRSIALTNGDRAYISRKGALYITLSSAWELSEELTGRFYAACEALTEGKLSFRQKVDPALLGGLRLRIGDTIYDHTVSNSLYRLEKALEREELRSSDAEEMLAQMERTAASAKTEIDIYQVGRVTSVSDGICWLDGVSDIMYGELIEFQNGERGMVLDVHPDSVGCVIFGRYEHIESFSRVRRLNMMASVPTGEALLGRVVDALGKPIDGKGRLWNTVRRPIECKAPAIPDRQSVSVPLDTGIKAIDALVPIGRGQRELIIGDRQTGKTAIVLDTIINQKDKNVICIYVAVGQKEASVAELVERLTEHGAMEHTIVVSAGASAGASMQYIAPFAGAAMGEAFMYAGRDVLIIYDDLSKHAVAYRELSLLLHRPSGREAFPGDIFYLHSRLLERAARLSPELGGGSMTALPVIETQAGDISAYVPTNVISITDGQIFLETELFNAGQRPAINVGLSVSRVGGAAQTKLMKQCAAGLRTSLAQYRELAAFTQFGADVDGETKRVLDAGERMMEALRQGRYAPLPGWKQALLIFAVSNGYADRVAHGGMESYAEALYAWFESTQGELKTLMESGNKLDAEGRDRLCAALGAFAAKTEG